MTPAQKRAETIRKNKEQAARMALVYAENERIVAGGKCPHCGSGLKRNLALSGWWQCEQYGSDGFRARNQDPQCPKSGQWFVRS